MKRTRARGRGSPIASSGRFAAGGFLAVSGVVGQDNTYYFGGVAGGVWKTTDGGLNWKPLFDKQKDASPSIGALAVSESDPNIIYVGTERLAFAATSSAETEYTNPSTPARPGSLSGLATRVPSAA